jgi:hypothetical protein
MRIPFAVLALVGGVLALAGACSVQGADPASGGGGGGSTAPPSATRLCEEQCIPQFPDGEGVYFGVRACILCGACSVSCGADKNSNCAGVAAVPDTCSESFPECGSCANDGCAWVQQPDTTVVGACANEVTACLGTPACVSLYNCVVSCLQTPTGTGGTTGGGGMMGVGGTL